MKFTRLGFGSPGHTRQLFIHSEIILNGNGGISFSFLFDRNPFLGLNRLVQPITPTPAWHQSSSVFIHNHNLGILDHILFVLFIQAIGTKKLGNRMNTLALNLKFTLRSFSFPSLIILRDFIVPVNLDIEGSQIRNYKPFRIIGANQSPSLLGQISLLVFFINYKMKVFFKVISSFFVVIRIHIQIELLKSFSNLGILHHP